MTISLDELKKVAAEIGLDDLGLVPASESRTYPLFEQWLEAGEAGEMSYLTRNKEARRHPDSILPGVRTLLIGLITLHRLDIASNKIVNDSNGGELIPYSVRVDYHDVLRKKLQRLANVLKTTFPSEKFRTVVDTAPILEKEWAVRAGLGQIGKNSLLIHPRFGTEIFLGILLSTATPDSFTGWETQNEDKIDPCRGCSLCANACPTSSLSPDRTLHAKRCLNYWTMEYRGAEFPDVIKEKLGNRIFGCDACRRVCPHNKTMIPPTTLSFEKLAKMTSEEFQSFFAATPIERMGMALFRRPVV